MDAYDGSPILDLKAYMPFCGRVRTVRVPDWAAGWPQWLPEKGLGFEE
jgi:tRNA (Thr-GGU) A37 N-methylase